jgi:hypothetical protein
VSVPEFQIDLEMIVCSRHGEPFRPQWPKGFAALTILVLELIQTDEALGAERKAIDADNPAPGYMSALRNRPACERVDRDRLMAIYMAAEIAVDGVCIVCGRRAPGTEYQRTETRRLATLTRRRVVVDRHVCFDCVLTRMAPAP